LGWLESSPKKKPFPEKKKFSIQKIGLGGNMASNWGRYKRLVRVGIVSINGTSQNSGETNPKSPEIKKNSRDWYMY